jgi:hypothetical protein
MMNVQIDEKKLIKWLVVIAISIIVLHVINVILGEPSWRLTKLVNLDAEANLPTWFSSGLLFIAAFFSYQCFLLEKSPTNKASMWQILSLGFLGMSLDEIAQFHETSGILISKYIFHLDKKSYLSWAFTTGPIVFVAIAIFSIKLFKYFKNSKKARNLFFLGVCLYFFGAFILEMVGTNFYKDDLIFFQIIETTLEESCEMFGVIIMIRGLMEQLLYLRSDALKSLNT